MEANSSGQSHLEVAEDVLYQPIDDEIVLLDLKSQQYYGLDSVGARIWQLLAETGDTTTVVDKICDEYDADRAQVMRDVESMIDDFRAAGLVKERTK